MKTTEQYLDSIGEKGEMKRLKAIAALELGERSKAARRAIHKRNRRNNLMVLGLSFDIACAVVNKEQ